MKVKQWVAAICQGWLQLIHLKRYPLVGTVIAKIIYLAFSMFRTNAPCKALVTGYYEFSKQPKVRFELRKINLCNLSCLNCIFRLDPLFYTRMNHIHIRNFLVHSFIILSEVLSDGISFFFGLDATFTLNLKSTDITKLNCYLHAKTIKRSNPNPTIGKREKAVYKDLHHRINCCNLCLCGDIEVNPGPTFVDPTRTIYAHCHRQCVTMSLCSLIYVYRNGSILDSTTLVNIMNLGNELYSMV